MAWKDNLEQTFTNWSKRSSLTEEQKCENALGMIKSAITASPSLSSLDIQFLPQGSYHNNTNVRQESDVDICVKLKSTFFYHLPNGKTYDMFNIIPSSYSYAQYRNEVETALVNKFGREHVVRGNKAFDIHSNSYRVDADVVTCFEHRRYDDLGRYISGTEFITDSGDRIVNFPEQHYENGVGKNNITSRRFKRIVRILKRLKIQMDCDGRKGLENISSFLIESLVWNVPNHIFGNTNYKADVEEVLRYLYQNTVQADTCQEWGEVSELLYLFRGRNYTNVEVNRFILNAYAHAFN